jgi:hypothetical protein
MTMRQSHPKDLSEFRGLLPVGRRLAEVASHRPRRTMPPLMGLELRANQRLDFRGMPGRGLHSRTITENL